MDRVIPDNCQFNENQRAPTGGWGRGGGPGGPTHTTSPLLSSSHSIKLGKEKLGTSREEPQDLFVCVCVCCEMKCRRKRKKTEKKLEKRENARPPPTNSSRRMLSIRAVSESLESCGNPLARFACTELYRVFVFFCICVTTQNWVGIQCQRCRES